LIVPNGLDSCLRNRISPIQLTSNSTINLISTMRSDFVA